MKRSLPLLCSGLLLAGLTLTALPTLGSASAAPRVGGHDGFTRLVFALPGPSTLSSALGAGAGGARVLSVTLKVPLKAERGTLAQPGVTSYVQGGRKISVQLAAGVRTATARMFPAGGGQPNRLVIDVPLSGAVAVAPAKPVTVRPVTVKPFAARPAPAPSARPVIRPASTAKPPTLTVVLDAGHGGSDPGMVSRWVIEKEVTLDVALRVRKYLTQHGVDVIMVRSTDTQLAASKRDDLEKRSNLARAGTVNAYVSIHVNSGSSAASGIETFYFGSTLGSSKRSNAVFENGGGSTGQELTRQASNTAQNLMGDLLSQAKLAFSAQLASSVQTQLIGMTGAENRGVHADAFFVIRNPTVPAILTEIGFGSNPSEGAKLAQAGYRDRVAGAIAKGILKFLKVK